MAAHATRIVLASLLALVGSWAATLNAGPLTDEQIDLVIARAQRGFWGNAVDSQGNKYELQEGEDPTALLIPIDDARRIVVESGVYGLALWCDIDWKATYLDYMRWERYRGWDERQIAFIGLLCVRAAKHTRAAHPVRTSVTTPRNRSAMSVCPRSEG